MGNYRQILAKKIKRLRGFVAKNRKRAVTLVSIILAVVVVGYLLFKYLIVASVNGFPITRFEVIKLLERQGGAQALDNLVTRKLIAQEARKQNISISQEEINAELDTLRGTLEGRGKTLEDALALQGQNLESLTEDIRLQQLVEKILADEIAVSEDEISNYFKENRDLFAKGATLEEVGEQIREQLKQDKLATAFNDWISQLRESSSIKRYLNY